jgi:hypothetical protein
MITAELITMYSPNFLLCVRSHAMQILRAVVEDLDFKTLNNHIVIKSLQYWHSNSMKLLFLWPDLL